MTSETSENTIFVRFYLTLCYAKAKRLESHIIVIIVINFLPLKKDDVPQTSGERTSQGKLIHLTDF